MLINPMLGGQWPQFGSTCFYGNLDQTDSGVQAYAGGDIKIAVAGSANHA